MEMKPIDLDLDRLTGQIVEKEVELLHSNDYPGPAAVHNAILHAQGRMMSICGEDVSPEKLKEASEEISERISQEFR